MPSAKQTSAFVKWRDAEAAYADTAARYLETKGKSEDNVEPVTVLDEKGMRKLAKARAEADRRRNHYFDRVRG